MDVLIALLVGIVVFVVVWALLGLTTLNATIVLVIALLVGAIAAVAMYSRGVGRRRLP